MSRSRLLFQYLRRHRLRYALGVACLLAATSFALAIPWAVKGAVDALRSEGAAAPLGRYVLLILVLAAAQGAARLGSRFTMLGAGQWVEHDLRADLFRALAALPPGFYQRHRIGDLMSRAGSDLSAVRALAGFGSVMLAGTSLTFAGALGAMWMTDPWLTLCAMAPFPFLIMLVRRFQRAVDARSTAVQEQLGALSAKVQENLAGMAVVRAYTMEAREIEDFERLNRELLARGVALARVQAVSWPLMGLVAGVGALIVLWVGGRAVVDGRITLGAFVAFNGYLAYLAWPTIALGWTLASVQRGLASLERIAEILAARPGDYGGPEPGPGAMGPAQLERLRTGAVEFRHLTFAYDGRPPALSDVSFTVPAGGLVAVVGPTGSGKSTLGALLCRLYEPPRGTVFLGGVDVRDLPLPVLRRSVGYVPQEAFLFSRSIRENVLLADEEAGEERLMAAARVAGLADEVRGFPAGWDTVVGERGLALSGGQRQRAGLARALVADPPYLVLDDTFSAVDTATEGKILQALGEALRGRTTLLITHRLRAAQTADRIIILDEGRVVETGRHADLLAAGGLYARLWRVQQLEDELARA
jgi:ATP-binding cassette subfamily B protein